jgi:hypothetical protein
LWRLVLADDYATPPPPVHEVDNRAGNAEDCEHNHEQSKRVINLATLDKGGWGGWR